MAFDNPENFVGLIARKHPTDELDPIRVSNFKAVEKIDRERRENAENKLEAARTMQAWCEERRDELLQMQLDLDRKVARLKRELERLDG